MAEPSPDERRQRRIDLASRALGVVVFGTLTVLLALEIGQRIRLVQTTPVAMPDIVSLVSKCIDLLALAALVTIFVVRHRPVRKSQGVVRRIVALVAAFGVPYVVLLPRFDEPLAAMLAASLSLVGYTLLVVSLGTLGRSFSIFPEARRLVTAGPYAVVRHPLYLAEELVILGLVVNHLHWASVAIAAVHLGLQILRMGWEEGVLESTFPEYADYRRRVWRFIPGIW